MTGQQAASRARETLARARPPVAEDARTEDRLCVSASRSEPPQGLRSDQPAGVSPGQPIFPSGSDHPKMVKARQTLHARFGDRRCLVEDTILHDRE
jgi:hypothetical protein